MNHQRPVHNFGLRIAECGFNNALLRCSLLALLLLLTAHCLLPTVAGQSTSATLSGTVTDQNGAIVPGAKVTVINIGTRLERDAKTNEEGNFTVPLLPPSNYKVRVEAQGFAVAEIENVILNVGDQKSLQINLKAGNISEMVQITTDAPLVSTSGAVGTVVNRQFVENIPLNGRSFQSLITLTPGVVLVPGSTNSAGQFSVNGQRASANAFIVDGVSANIASSPGSGNGLQTSGNLPGLTSFGSTQSLVSVDAMQEFKVQTSSYSSEYGRQPGGQISIVTRSGTNEFHGSVFDYIRNDVLDANDWFANANKQPRPPERLNDFGGTFGGPLLLPGYDGRNRSFFFFSYEGLRLRLPKFQLTNVPTLCLRGQGSCPAGQTAAPAGMQPILKAFPLPNGRDLGNGFAEFSASYSDPSSLNATSIRIDHAIGSKLALFGRYNDAPSKSKPRSSGSMNLIDSKQIDTKTLTFGLTASFTPKIINELRVNYSDNSGFSSREQDAFGGTVPIPRSALVPSQFDSGGSSQGAAVFSLPGVSGFPQVGFVDSNFVPQRQLNVVNNLSYSLSKHQLKFGVDYRRLHPVFGVNSYLNNAIFSSLTEILNGAAGLGIIQASVPVEPLYTNFSAYAQDTWKFSQRLTFNFGLRWDVNPPPSEAHGNLPPAVTQIDNFATTQLALRGTRLWKTTYGNFAPRFGVSHQVKQKPGRELLVRGGFGVFYDTGNDQSASIFTGFPFSGSKIVTNELFPLDLSQAAPPLIPILQSTLTPPFNFPLFDPQLKLPYTLQWNAAVEQSLGKSQSLTVSYVGAAGRRLLQRRQLTLRPINPIFASTTSLTTNQATSDYNALQVQGQRRLSRGLQGFLSYTWSHAIDEDSISSGTRLAQRGNADFDIRHIFAGAITYDIPSLKGAARVVFSRFSVDATVHAQSAPPVDIVAGTLTNPADGTLMNIRPNVIAGIPLYAFGSQYPGGRIINNVVPTAAQIAGAGCRPLPAAPAAPNAKGAFCTPLAGQSGNLGRNQLRGLPTWQIDVAVRREIPLAEKVRLQIRGEAFNLLNHPNFGTIQTTLTASNFGQATNMLNQRLGGISALYQLGGPRSLQFALKLLF